MSADGVPIRFNMRYLRFFTPVRIIMIVSDLHESRRPCVLVVTECSLALLAHNCLVSVRLGEWEKNKRKENIAPEEVRRRGER